MKNNKILLLIIFIFTGINIMSAQTTISDKTREKRIKKLRKKYKYVLVDKKCESALVGRYINGFNDGGGMIYNKLADVKIISLLDKKLTPWNAPYPRASLSFYNYKTSYGTIRIIDNSNKVGLINVCHKIILKPKYDVIGSFNKEGLAIASVGNRIDVINLKGQSVLKNSLKYHFDFKKFNKINTYPEVYHNLVVIQKENKKYGLLNIKNEKVITNQEYDDIDAHLYVINRNDWNKRTIGYKALRDGKITIIDTTGNEIIKPFFKKLLNLYYLKDNIFVLGVLDNGKINLLDTKNNKLVLPKSIENTVNNAKPLDQDLWVLEFDTPDKPASIRWANKYTECGVYSLKKNDYIINRNRDYKFDYGNISVKNDFIIIRTKNNHSTLFSRKTGKLITKNYKPEYKHIFLKNENKTRNYMLVCTQPIKGNSLTYCTLYDGDGKKIFEKEKLFPMNIFVKNDFFYIKQSYGCYPCKEGMTAYDIDGNIIGEKHNYKPKK